MDYYVRKNESAAQKGSFESPFSTISQAAAIAKAGDRIFIGEGIYREHVDPVNGGTDDCHRIVYTAIEGEHPVISGAEIIEDWTRVGDDLFSLQKDRLTTEKLGRAFEPEDLYEDPNGDPIRLDTDFCENEWGEKVFSGPFSRPVERIFISKVF